MEQLYRKIGKRYVPTIEFGNNLDEGIWLVTKRPGIRSTTNVQYLLDCFHIDRKEPVNLNLVCNMEDVCDDILHSEEFNEMTKGGCSFHDIVHLAVKMVYDKNKA
jgi:hypothetical protein